MGGTSSAHDKADPACTPAESEAVFFTVQENNVEGPTSFSILLGGRLCHVALPVLLPTLNSTV